ncbi:plasmid pRiA4b ORF-3 family protein [Mariniplasma anaerobium]|uniref:Plasmid pRiA4b ORF-3 family protein n=1 Tax=Mariniplasma anaerobium TaxID=2735436 RepID=A0A7U9TI33_9MOLU|nr:plasmid pRiA4b ORF-3 family protein [Mariniplasma anaerobium]BCR36146.1 plasmid pRiA4b ORF-3 family protein [Mariniplasma anaerobium]
MAKIYQFYVELRDSSPKIWRTIQVRQRMTVAEFVYILLPLFEMQASHLFKVNVPVGKMQVEKNKKVSGDAFDEKAFLKEHPELPKIRYRYELLDMIDDFSKRENDIIFNVTKESLKYAISEIGERMELWYDFGDDWFIDIKLKDIFDTDDSNMSPIVLEGEGFGIIEDCGGVWRLNDIIKAFKSKKSKSFQEYRDWLGIEDFNFSLFEKDEMNERLQVIPQIYKRCYEEKKALTDQEIKYIERKI